MQLGDLEEYIKQRCAEIKVNLLPEIADTSRCLSSRTEQNFILSSIEKETSKKITNFALIYRKDQQDPSYLRTLTAKVPNILVLVKTDKDKNIACYSSRSICERRDEEKTRGLLISLHSKKSYSLKPKFSPITKDYSNIILGN